MTSESPDLPRTQPASSLDAAVSAVEQRLDALAPDAKPETVTAALDAVLAPLARAAKEVLR